MLTFEQIFVPIWDTDMVYGETFTMYRNEDGKVCAPFLYKPEEIISVQSATYEKTYEEGKDWYVEGDMLYLTENTSIPFMEYEDIFMKEPLPGHSFPYPEGHLLFYEGHFFQDRQIAVTYKCKKGGWKGYIPQFEGARLPKTMKKLKEDKQLRVVLFGDSISAGSNASGRTINPPFQPIWGELVCEKLRRSYGADIKFINVSVGGTDSVWGMKETEERVCANNPDLLILGFGMNGSHKPEVLKEHIDTIIKKAKETNPDLEVIIISTSTPNPILTSPAAKFWNYQCLYKEALEELCGEGVVLANVRDVQKELHSRKRFIDTTGNNVNHPNDFFIRIHAQILTAMLVEK